MALQFTSETITGRNVVFDLMLEDIPGGCQLDTGRLNSATKWVEQGTPVYVDRAARVAYLIKTTYIAVSGDADTIYVPNDHHFAVGDIMWDGTSGMAITSITASGDYDKIELAGSLVTYATNTVLTQVDASGTAGATTTSYVPNGFVKDTIAAGDGAALYSNLDVSVIVRGSVRNSALPFPLSTTQKAAMTHFTFNA